MEYSIKKAVVTGGTGPVGLALVRKLLAEDVEVLLFQRDISARKMYLPEHKNLHIVNCRLEELFSYIPADTDYDVFFHLGWAHTTKDRRNDMELQLRNVRYTLDAIRLAKRMGCHTFLGVGSQAECGYVNGKINSQTPCNPHMGYGIGKECAYRMSKVLCKEQGIRFLWNRIISVYGIYDNIYSALISTILKCLKGETEKLEFTEGRQIWDFLYVDDAAEAMYMTALRGRDGSIYVMGSGEERSLRESIEITIKKTGKQVYADFGAIPYNDNMYLVADISEIKRDTGWYPKTSFEEGIAKTIEFYRRWIVENEDCFHNNERIERDAEKDYETKHGYTYIS